MTDIPIMPPQDILPATRIISEEEWNEYQDLKEAAEVVVDTDIDEVVSDFGYPGPKA